MQIQNDQKQGSFKHNFIGFSKAASKSSRSPLMGTKEWLKRYTKKKNVN